MKWAGRTGSEAARRKVRLFLSAVKSGDREKGEAEEGGEEENDARLSIDIIGAKGDLEFQTIIRN